MTESAMDVKALRKFLDADLRARQMVDTAVVYAMAERGEPEDGRVFRRYAHDIASRATAALLKMIYEEDAELARLKSERDIYKEIAEKYITHMPPQLTVVNPRGLCKVYNHQIPSNFGPSLSTGKRTAV